MNEYLEQIKARKGFTSDNQIAQALDVTRQAVSNYRCGKTVPDDYTAAKMAELLGRPPMELIAAANAERTKSAKERKFWERMLSTAALLAIMPAVYAVANVSVCILCKIAERLPRRCDALHTRASTA